MDQSEEAKGILDLIYSIYDKEGISDIREELKS
jgi:hypothetical protein